MYNSLIVPKVSVEVQGVFGETLHINSDPDCTIGEIRDYLSHRTNTYVDELITHNGVAISDNARIINYYPRVFKLQPKQKIILQDAEDYIASQNSLNASHNKSYSTQHSYSRKSWQNSTAQEELQQQQHHEQPAHTFDTEDKLYSCEEEQAKDNRKECINRNNDIVTAPNQKENQNKSKVCNNVMQSEMHKESNVPNKLKTDKIKEEVPRNERVKPFRKRSLNHATKQLHSKQNALQDNVNAKRRFSISSKSSTESNANSVENEEKIEEPIAPEISPSQGMEERQSLPVSEINLTCKIPSHNTSQVVTTYTNENISDVLCKLHELQPSIDIKTAKIVYKDKVYDQDNKNTLFNLGIRTDAVISVATESFSDPSMCILVDLEDEYTAISNQISCLNTEKSKKEAYEKLMKILLRTDALQSLSGEWKERRKSLVKEVTKLQDTLNVQTELV